MKYKKKIQPTKMQTRKLQTRKLNKPPYTRKNRRYIGGAEPTRGFTDKLINRLLI